MAKIKWSAIGITNASGKSGGTVFSHNRGGSYIRRWAKPVNAQNAAQTLIRNIFAFVSRAWGSLTPTQVAAWEDYGKTNPKPDAFGDMREQTGHNAFMGVNLTRAAAGFTGILTSPMPKIDLPGVVKQEFTLGTTSKEIQYIFDRAVVAGENIRVVVSSVVVNAGQNLSFGSIKNKFGNPFTVQLVTATDNILEIDATSSPVFGSLVAGLSSGDTMFIKMEVMAETGQRSSPLTNSATQV